MLPARAPLAASLAISIAIVAMSALGFAATLLAFYPGYLTNDAGFVYGFMTEGGGYGDWQSPVMILLWRLIDPIAPGPASMFLLIATLYWLGFALIALAAVRRSVWVGLAVPLLALMPPAVLMLVMIWRDMLFGVVWLIAAALVYAVTPASRLLRPAQVIALLLIAFGVLLRPTAIVAAPLLAMFVLWPLRFDGRRAALLYVPGVVVGYLVIHLVYYVALDAKRENPLHSVFVFDLGGITHFSGENQFPVTWSPQETALLTSTCYNPDRWDTYWTMEPCRFVMQRLEAPGDLIFGTPRLRDAWLGAVTTHPLAYLRHRLTYFWTFLAAPTLTLELYRPDDPVHTPLTRNPYFKMAIALHDALKPTFLFRMGFWLALGAAIAAFAWQWRATPSGALALGASTSGIAVIMSFLPVGVAADFRYGYWGALAALVGLAAALAAPRERA